MLQVSDSFRSGARLGAVVWRALSWPARVAEARRTLAFLGQMTDRELSDIGLLRSDLVDCAALPLDEDPSRRLAATRAARVWPPGSATTSFGEQAGGQSPSVLRRSAA